MATLKLTLLLAVVNVSLLESLPHHHQQAMMTYRDILREEWSAFKQLYRKQYPVHPEEQFRFQVFLENKHAIAVHNQAAARGEKSYTMELNHYGDLLQEEFVDLMNGFRPSKSRKSSGRTLFLTPRNMNLPGAIDWREHNLVTAVKDQGECGSCWAFSATGALEGQHSRASGQLVELSEQNLVDCVHYPGTNETYGCDGGTMDGAFEYVKSNGGIDTEQSYPYEHVLGVCRFNKTNIGATDAGEVDIPSGDEAKLQEAVASVGPISVAIDAGQPGFQHYKEGVFDEPSCNNAKEQLNHGVLVVGYGTDATSGKDYWLVKNSWSSGWGDAGYVKMVRNKDNQCGIATDASYPLV